MITHLRLIAARGLLSVLLALFSTATPLAGLTYANDCAPPDTSQPGVRQPIGADAALYHYDCGTGKWVSSRYTYDPDTGQITANEPLTYTYNKVTGKYDTQIWVYSAPKGDYVLVDSSVATPPAGANVIGGPAPAATANSISDTGSGSTNGLSSNGSGSNSISNTGAGSNNGINNNGNNNLTSDSTNLLTVANILNGTSTSGNAMVLQNTTAGSATSGDADNVYNVVNMLQSTGTDLGSGNVVTFVYDINGDVNGDLLFDPNAVSNVQNAGTVPSGNNQLTINNSTDASITNDLTLNSTSGDASVRENTTAGDATSGNARAVANIVNIINSAISSGRSFIGTININGNLNGDILLPPDFIDQLIAANVPTVDIILDTGANSNNNIGNSSTNNTNVTNNVDQSISNNVNANSTSGNASVSQNTTAGSATTGNAANSITAFNLTGSEYLGNNALLVFVNVTGKWVGLIVNAPQGSTAAALGGGGSISRTGTGSNNAISSSASNNTDVNNNVKQSITNNVDINARSGNADVSRNTTAGNAKSGDANTAVNLMNMSRTSLSLKNWFGILFINVFGTWNGSFGVNTSAGDPVAMAQASGGSQGPAIRAFGFVPGGVGPDNKTTYSLAPYGGGTGGDENAMREVSNNVTAGITEPTDSGNKPSVSGAASQVNWTLIVASSSLFTVYLLADRYGENLRRLHRPSLRIAAARFRSFL